MRLYNKMPDHLLKTYPSYAWRGNLALKISSLPLKSVETFSRELGSPSAQNLLGPLER